MINLKRKSIVKLQKMELTDIIIFLLFLILPWFKVMNLKLKTNLINKNCFQFVLSENASFDRLGSVEDFCPEKPVCTIIRSPKNISTGTEMCIQKGVKFYLFWKNFFMSFI